MEDNSEDRTVFYENLSKCKSKIEIENLIDRIDDEDLYVKILDKYNQIVEFNQGKSDEKLVKDIIKILEFTYLRFCKES